VHHNFDDSDTDYGDQKQGKSFGIAGYRGRIIFLGDGTEVLTDSDDTEMFDNSEEDKDLVSQVSRSTSQEGNSESAADKTAATDAGPPAAAPPVEQEGETKFAGENKVDEKTTEEGTELKKDA
jgi:protein phosphatase 2C family protein 2/3